MSGFRHYAVYVRDAEDAVWHLAPRHLRRTAEAEALCGLTSAPPPAPWARVRWRLPEGDRVCRRCRRAVAL